MGGSNIIPVSAIIATRNRPVILERTVLSIMSQSSLPMELVIVDGSDDEETRDFVLNSLPGFESKMIYLPATTPGAASQRVQGMSVASQSIIWFLDDDILLEQDCTQKIFGGFGADPNVGAVNAMITNQRYTSPGFLTRMMYLLMSGNKFVSYAGKLIGPAWNLLPEDNSELPEYVPCEWLNTTCTMYRREAMPSPVFPDFFKGYSLMEDVTLSVTIGKSWMLLNARNARIFHDSQSGSHKDNIEEISTMSLVNRFHVMTAVLNRTQLKYYFKLFMLESFFILTSLRSKDAIRNFPRILRGKFKAVKIIIKSES